MEIEGESEGVEERGRVRKEVEVKEQEVSRLKLAQLTCRSLSLWGQRRRSLQIDSDEEQRAYDGTPK